MPARPQFEPVERLARRLLHQDLRPRACSITEPEMSPAEQQGLQRSSEAIRAALLSQVSLTHVPGAAPREEDARLQL
jgi:hypothetical protein